MSYILYYSNYCAHSKEVISIIGKSTIQKDIYFICIDNRKIGTNGAIYIILNDNKTEVLLPPNITKVPALLFLDNHHVLYGNDILRFIQPKIEDQKNKATDLNGEPESFGINHFKSGIISDQYSYLDQSADELSSKGNGGMRQKRHYVSLDETIKINTPPEDYSPDTINNTIGNVSLEQLQRQRENEIKVQKI